MAQRTRLYFATDLHGSEKCFRKFLNGGAAYKADVLVLGGDIGGKAIQAIVERADGTFTCTFRGKAYELENGAELQGLEQLISDHGTTLDGCRLTSSTFELKMVRLTRSSSSS